MTPSHAVSAVDQTITGIRALHQQVRNHELSPSEIVDSCVGRIERLNPTLNAFMTVLAAQARCEAKVAVSEISAGRHHGPLHGVPVGIKDFYDTAGIRTSAAFEHFKDRIPGKDAAGVNEDVLGRVGRDIAQATELSGSEYGVLSRLAAVSKGEIRQQALATLMAWDRVACLIN